MNSNNFYDILKYAAEHHISDIHSAEDQPVYIRNEVGDMQQVEFLFNRDEIYGFANDILPADKIDLLVSGFEIDAAYTYKDARFRINFYFDKFGINVALRRINANPPSLEQIDIPENLKPLFLKEKGLILVTGPTGSGKSTTLASILQFISENRKCHIITLEDPVEYILSSENSRIVQREIGKNTPNWLSGIKYSLRQDPDVIMIGEMRDIESISSVLTLVETGHLVLATLHTSDALHSLTRIIDAFPPHQQPQVAVQLSMSLELVICQKLLPRKDQKGVVAAREIMINNNAIANLTRERKFPNIYGVIETQLATGMMTMDHSLAKLVAENKIDKDIAYTKIKNHDLFPQLVEYYRKKYIYELNKLKNEQQNEQGN